MNRLVYFVVFTQLLLPQFLQAQPDSALISGKVMGKSSAGEKLPLIGANVYWAGTTSGTVTDVDGTFEIERHSSTSSLVATYVGYQNDTINVTDKQEEVSFTLEESIVLEEVEVVHRKKSTEISLLDPLKVENIGEEELTKAACCNLSESFETTPSVDVSFTDAITGTRQIQMLGLAGPYTQITREGLPVARGLSSVYGLTYIPGTWVESIQLNKGTGSVVNGYEAIAGQINVELQKPEEMDRLYFNLYANEGSRTEANAHFAHRINDKLSTAVLLHGKNNFVEMDRNSDGFMDMPIGQNLIGLNRWKYFGPNGIRLQAGVKGTYTNNIGGQIGYEPTSELADQFYGVRLLTERMEGWAKVGKVFKDAPWKSVGLQLSAVDHLQDSRFGRNTYRGKQRSFYANLMYQSIFSTTDHVFKAGASLQADQFHELVNNREYEREEIVPGSYFEYTFKPTENFSAVAGLRGDYHNLYGFFATPRLHLRYAVTESSTLRASVGRGQKTANIFSDNNALFASSREWNIVSENDKLPYGLSPEVAWNYGLNFSQCFKLDYREGTITFDAYRTDFTNQVVIDLDQNTQEIWIYNLEGQSFSNSFQAQVDYELIRRLDVRLAYRWFDVQTTYHGELMQKPLVANHRAFINLAYETRNYWKFDLTAQWQGSKRMPTTETNPEEYRLPANSPDFFLMNAQVSKKWGARFELYSGVENLLNFKQTNPILSSENPYSPYFDSTMIWGPVFGRNIYAGLRYTIK